MAESTHRVVPAVDKAARLLAELGSGETLGISELARRIAASKGTVRDILLTLASHGIVERTSDLRFRRVDTPDLATLAAPRLRSLMQEFGETALLGIVSGEHFEIVAREEPATDLHMSASIGRRIPLRTGAHGKVLTGGERVGYDDEEYLPGVRAAAAPISDTGGRRIAAIVVVGFKQRIDARALRRIGERCAQVASELSARLPEHVA
ncbi:MAG: IclR family transcriptional regulator [Candidatus Limnocylindria bacterium]